MTIQERRQYPIFQGNNLMNSILLLTVRKTEHKVLEFRLVYAETEIGFRVAICQVLLNHAIHYGTVFPRMVTDNYKWVNQYDQSHYQWSQKVGKNCSNSKLKNFLIVIFREPCSLLQELFS